MSESNIEIYQRAIEAFNREGVDGVLRYFHPDAEVYDPDAPEGRVYRGREAIARFIGELVDGSEIAVRELRMFPAGDRVVGMIHTHHRSREDHSEVGIIEAHTLTFRDGRIAYWRAYLDPVEALSDPGLDPAILEERGLGDGEPV